MASRSRAFDGWARSRAEEWLGRLTRLLLRRTRETGAGRGRAADQTVRRSGASTPWPPANPLTLSRLPTCWPDGGRSRISALITVASLRRLGADA